MNDTTESSVEEVSLAGGILLLEKKCQRLRGISFGAWCQEVVDGKSDPYSHDNPNHGDDAMIAMVLGFAGIDLADLYAERELQQRKKLQEKAKKKSKSM